MRNTKKIIFAVSVLLPLSAGTAVASSEIWAPGVTRDSGWYDVNKRSTTSTSEIDRKACWAAAASNMLQWWFDRYEEAGKTVPSNIPLSGSEKYNCGIFEKCFLPNWDPNYGASSYDGLRWFFEGTSPNVTTNYSKPTGGGDYFLSSPEILAIMDSAYNDYHERWNTLNTLNTYNYSLAAQTEDYAVSLVGYYTWGTARPPQGHSPAEFFTNYLKTMLKYGPAGLGFAIGINGGGINHEITVWGCGIGEDGFVSKIIVSDSDDAQGNLLGKSLKEYNVSYRGNYVAIDYNEAGRLSGNYITQLTGIMGYPIPEPSSFSLLAGIAALAVVASRHSRKSK